ncbi:16S rRNA (cytosine(967)-C(5))-methyltransferase RsmB [soil metagenome]
MSTPDGAADPAAEPAAGVASRQAAASALIHIHAEQAWASPVVDRVLTAGSLDLRDRSFVANLVFSALRWEGTLDWVLAGRISRSLNDVEVELLDVLRLGTWELLYGNAPSRAVVHAWVEVARLLVGQRATGFVNGVLRGVTRAADDLPWPDPTTDEGLALQYGYPIWVVTEARQRFGDARAAAVLDAGNQPAPLVLRALGARDDLLAVLADQGIEAEPGRLSRDAVVLSQRHVPGDLQVIRDGLATVQDQASQVIGLAAADGLPAGATAIDLCAAPGGKSTHLAQQGLQVTAVDRHAGRLRRTASLAAHLGLSIDTLLADGTATGLPEGQADLVLVDAPCSGLGVVRRRPELRWRRDAASVGALAVLQTDLLRAAVGLAKPGGRVAYAVCTWTEAETDAVVRTVVADGQVVEQPAPAVGTPTAFGVQMAPDTDDGDGMYLAVLQRRE